jgi:hypothetical protein
LVIIKKFEQNCIYRNGCAKEVSKKIKDRKNKNEHIKEIMGVKGKPDIIDIIDREEKTAMVWPRQKDARVENTKIKYGMDTTGEKENRTSKEDVNGRSTSCLDSKKFRTISMEKQRGMAFGFRKTATAVKKTQIDNVSICAATKTANVSIRWHE